MDEQSAEDEAFDKALKAIAEFRYVVGLHNFSEVRKAILRGELEIASGFVER